MAEMFDVTTPLGQKVCDNEAKIREHVAEYMKTKGASLNRITVIRVPETGNTTEMGEELSPAKFWTPSD